MSLLKGQLRSWSGGGFYDPLGFSNKILPAGADNLFSKGPLGNSGAIKQTAGSKLGSVLSGRAILQGGPQEQNMETGRTFDVFGSPATAGTKQQSTARLGAALYGLFMGGAALGAGGAGGTTSATAAPTASPAGGPFATNVGYAGGTGTAGASSGAGWQDYARMGNSMMQQGQPSQQQQGPLQHQMVGQPMYRNPYMMGYPWS